MEEPPGGLDVSVQARLVDPVRETGLSAIIVTHDLAVARLGLSPPTRAEMAEIEISSRLYRDAWAHCMTVVLPGRSETRTPVSDPVCFILSPDRLVTLRDHAPAPSKLPRPRRQARPRL